MIILMKNNLNSPIFAFKGMWNSIFTDRVKICVLAIFVAKKKKIEKRATRGDVESLQEYFETNNIEFDTTNSQRFTRNFSFIPVKVAGKFLKIEWINFNVIGLKMFLMRFYITPSTPFLDVVLCFPTKLPKVEKFKPNLKTSSTCS